MASSSSYVDGYCSNLISVTLTELRESLAKKKSNGPFVIPSEEVVSSMFHVCHHLKTGRFVQYLTLEFIREFNKICLDGVYHQLKVDSNASRSKTRETLVSQFLLRFTTCLIIVTKHHLNIKRYKKNVWADSLKLLRAFRSTFSQEVLEKSEHRVLRVNFVAWVELMLFHSHVYHVSTGNGL